MFSVIKYVKDLRLELEKISWTKREELTSIFFLILLFLIVSALLFSLLDICITFLISKVLYF